MGISHEILKLIACLAMLIDHIGYVFFPTSDLLRIIGRIAFPIYCFLLCQGLSYTKNPVRYILRLVLILIISEIPYDLLFYGKLTFDYQNVMFTLLLGLTMGLCIRRIPSLSIKILCILPFAIAADLLCADYGFYGICVIALFLLSASTDHPRLTECIGLALLSLYHYDMRVNIGELRIPFQLFTLPAMIPISLYRGKKVTTSPFIKWGFYLFYPLHLVVLLLIKTFIWSIC